MSPESDPDVVVLHGYVIDALYLPPSIGETNVYIIIQESIDGHAAEVISFDGDTVDELAEKIQGIVKDGCTTCSPFVTIDDIGILFGYELSLGLSFDDDGIEEGAIEEIAASLVKEA